jgi:hypothetical protein
MSNSPGGGGKKDALGAPHKAKSGPDGVSNGIEDAHPYLIKAVICPPAVEYKVEYEEKAMADYRFCHSAVEYEGLI